MILSNVELHRALDSGRLIIEPQPVPRQPSVGLDYCPYGTHSVDLKLAAELSIPKSGTFAYDLTQPGNLAEFIASNAEKKVIETDSPYRLQHGQFLLGMTAERIGLPIADDGSECLAARIEGKSSIARCGILVHFTAPTVHPGWEGPLTLEIINLGPAVFMLSPGMPIAQLIVEEVRGLPYPNPSQFQKQVHPEGSR